MEIFSSLFSVNSGFINILNYQMSYLEFCGTLFYLWSVWLAVKNSGLTWPIGNIGVALFLLLFYQIQLYSDFIEQVYFLVTGFYGWWSWYYSKNVKIDNKRRVLPITHNSTKSNVVYSIVILVGTVSMGYFMSNIHEYFPYLFPEPASLPYLDTFTTVMSFAANILMAQKKIECWYLWIFVDILDIGIYFVKNVLFISFLYIVFLILAIKGLQNWQKEYKLLEQTI